MQIVVGGCSFSSSLGIRPKQKYSVLMSRELKLTLVDEARVQGSNFRIWRTITSHIINNRITPKDKLIIQYTEPHRKEYWVPQVTTHEDPMVDEPYEGGKLFRYKFGADHYASGIEKAIYRVMSRSDSELYNQEVFATQHAMFTGLLQSRGFEQVVFVKTRYCNFTDENYVGNYPVVDCDDILEAQNLDGWHLSAEGHSSVAYRLLEFFQT